MTDKPSDAQLVADLLALLDPVPLGGDRFEGPRKKGGVGRVFGGQVIAQALIAAERTVDDDRAAHSLHAYFLRGGSEDHPIQLAVDRQLDGGSFSNRRVVASQPGPDSEQQPILNLAASFQKHQPGLEHERIELPSVPLPDELESDEVLRELVAAKLPERARRMFTEPRPIEITAATGRHWLTEGPQPPVQNSWFRARAANRRSGDPPRRARLPQRHATPRHEHHAAWPLVDARRGEEREPRPRNLVPCAVPRRRVDALPLRKPMVGREPGLQPWPDLPGRAPDRERRAGRDDPASRAARTVSGRQKLTRS
jgi:hypothetical protein